MYPIETFMENSIQKFINFNEKVSYSSNKAHHYGVQRTSYGSFVSPFDVLFLVRMHSYFDT
jgi:hypothetical protein